VGNVYSQNRIRIIKELRAVKHRAANGVHTHADYLTMVNTLIKLTDMVFKSEIEREKERVKD
jgi:hypothetical protein